MREKWRLHMEKIRVQSRRQLFKLGVLNVSLLFLRLSCQLLRIFKIKLSSENNLQHILRQ